MKSSIKPAITHLFTIGFAAIVALGLSAARASGQPPVKSDLGYHATSVTSADNEEGSFDTVIKKDGKQIATIPNAKPISFSPDGSILLLREAAADDRCRYFLLNVAAGEKARPFGQRDRIGGRYVEKAEWSKDGKTITFTNNAQLSDQPTETITVAEHLTQTPAK